MDDVLALAADIWNGSIDAPYFDGPNHIPGAHHWEASTHYGTMTAAFVKDGLSEEHDGDCTKQPQSCLRCNAEEYTALARYLWSLGYRGR